MKQICMFVAVPIVMETVRKLAGSLFKKNRTDLYREDMVHYVTDDSLHTHSKWNYA